MSRYRKSWEEIREQVAEATTSYTVRYRDPLNKKRFTVPFKTMDKAQAKMGQLKGDGVKEIEITTDQLKGKFREDLDNQDLGVVKKVIAKLDKASDAHASQRDMLKKAVKEADLTKGQIKQVHKMADELPKKDFKDRYGKEKGDAVRYATATNMIKKKLNIDEDKTPQERITDLQTRINDKQQKINDMDIGDPKQKTPIAIAKSDLDTMKLKLDDMKAKMRREETDPKTLLTKQEKKMQVMDEKIKGIQTKSDKSGIPYGILKQVYNRGMAAWKGGHRPGTTPQQWAFARVNSFITKGKSYYTADADLAKKARASKKKK